MERNIKLKQILWVACIGLCAFHSGLVVAENDDAIEEDPESDRNSFLVIGNHIISHFLQLRHSINTMTKSMEQLQIKIDAVNNEVHQIKNEVQKNNNKVQEVNNKVHEISNKIEEGNNKVEIVKNEVQEVINKVKVVDTVVEEVKNEVLSVNKEVQNIKDEVQHVKNEVQEINNKVEVCQFQKFEARLEEARKTKQYNSDGNKTMQDGDCGGIITSKNGSILYNYSPSWHEPLKCIWTIQANYMTTIAYKIFVNDFGCQIERSVTLFSVEPYGSELNYTLIRVSADGGEDGWNSIEGPLVFVSFDFRPSVSTLKNCSIASFELRFEGRDEDSSLKNRKFKHFQYADSEGFVAYPTSEEKYLPNEIVTFVINPTAIPIFVNLHFLNTEACCDKLIFFTEDENVNDSINYYLTPRNQRYSGGSGSVNYTIKPLRDGSPFIAIFHSDGSTQGRGVKFSWRAS